MKTARKKIIELIEANPMTTKEISQAVGIAEKEVISHLEHINHSIKTSGKKLRVQPAVCLSCGFKFTKRSKLSAPSRCPECKSTHIQDPIFSIE